MSKSHSFKVKLWVWPGDNAAWHFVSVPKKESLMFREKYKGLHRGWNSIKVKVKVGKTEWDTSIFFDSKSAQYLLPIKAKIRKAEGLFEGDDVNIKLTIV